MKKEENEFQIEGEDKSPVTDLNDVQVCDLPDRELEVTARKMFPRSGELQSSENFTKEIKCRKTYQTEILALLSNIVEVQYSVEGLTNEAEEKISELRDRSLEIRHPLCRIREQKEKD